jgi:hypothetical protein
MNTYDHDVDINIALTSRKPAIVELDAEGSALSRFLPVCSKYGGRR